MNCYMLLRLPTKPELILHFKITTNQYFIEVTSESIVCISINLVAGNTFFYDSEVLASASGLNSRDYIMILIYNLKSSFQ